MTLSRPRIWPERPRVAIPCGCTLGEGPIWDARRGELLFVDIEARTLLRWRTGEAEPRRHALPEKVGFVLLTGDPDRVLVGLASGLARFGLNDERLDIVLSPEPDRPGNRLNDGAAGLDGQVYFSSMDDGQTQPTGRFYRWDGVGPAQAFGEPTIVANGPAIDPERGALYASDTTHRHVYRHRLEADGTVGPRELLVAFGPGDGHPDGMTVDAEGHLWVAHFGGSRVTRFAPDGAAVLEVTVPTAQVTKVAFGGPDLGTLYVTTAAQHRDRTIDLQAGHVFAVETGIVGRPAELCRI